MYQSPDFIKVELNVKDDFASYDSCPADYSGQYMWTGEGCQDYFDPKVLMGGYASHQCYSTLNP